MRTATKPWSRYAALILVPAFLPTTSAVAETVILACEAPPEENLCPSHWIINGDAKTVTWRWCKSADSTERRNVEITPERITFDEDFMFRHYDYDRKTGRMTMTAGTAAGERWNDGVSTCRVVPK